MMFTIEQARKYSGLTQEEIAERMGVTPKTYIQYEKYRRVFDMKQAFHFSALTGIGVDQLIFFEGQQQKFCTKEAVR